MPLPSPGGRAALVVAHPSHELRVHGWLQQTRPLVFVLTDGAGRHGESRLARSTEVLRRAGARPGPVYGRLTDLEVYAAILGGDAALFAGLVEEYAAAFAREGVEYVVGDAAEGYNTTHDLCRVMIGAAVELAGRKYNHRVANYDFAVVGAPDESLDESSAASVRLCLDEESFARKVAAALDYSPRLAEDVGAALRGAPFQGVRRFSELRLAGEVDGEVCAAVMEELESRPAVRAKLKDIVEGVGLDAFRVERLRPVGNRAGAERAEEDEPLFYELYGEKLVAAGRYREAIRYREHVWPLAEEVRARVGVARGCVSCAS